MPLAIQTNAWLDKLHRSDLPSIVEQIARAGYDALEIGAQRLNLDDPDGFLMLIHQHKEAIRVVQVQALGADFEGVVAGAGDLFDNAGQVGTV